MCGACLPFVTPTLCERNVNSPVRHGLLLFEYIAYFIAIEYKQQIRMPNETAHLGHFTIVHMQLVHHLIEVTNFIGACKE